MRVCSDLLSETEQRIEPPASDVDQGQARLSPAVRHVLKRAVRAQVSYSLVNPDAL